MILHHGLRVLDGHIYCGDIKISEAAMSRAAGVDRRVVITTVETIEKNPDIRDIYKNLHPIGHLKDVAPLMGWGAIAIVPSDASASGILSGIAYIIAKEGLSVRQVVVDDPDVVEVPKCFIITDSPIPSHLLQEIKMVPGVKSVALF